ncbi:MAG: M50 family metallopeptidase [Pseudomonadota bacterium]
MRALRGHWQLLALTGLVFVTWQTPVVTPLKILFVFFHELSHAAAAWATGGAVLELQVSARQGGYAVTAGGSRFWILSAGYLGSLLIGVALLILAVRTRADRAVLGGLGALLLMCTALYVRDTFALLFCGGAGAAMLAAARLLPRQGCDLILRVIGLTSLLYVPYDIFDDTLRRSALRSDAQMLAEEVGGTTMLWGGAWLVLSLIVILWVLLRGLGARSNLGAPRRR